MNTPSGRGGGAGTSVISRIQHDPSGESPEHTSKIIPADPQHDRSWYAMFHTLAHGASSASTSGPVQPRHPGQFNISVTSRIQHERVTKSRYCMELTLVEII